MPKKKKKVGKAAEALPWILANNPDQDNTCQCFKKSVPSNKWIVVARFPNVDLCRRQLTDCNDLFMKKPIR